MPKFSDEQQKVIDERNKNLLVSASAGSGKTTVMIERIVRLIEEGKTKLSRILVLTFTNNSANDMKEKLYTKLSQSENKNCKEALFDIAAANISNIHQFCKKLIQKYFYVCDVDPAFEVISENEALVLKDKALDKTIDKFFFEKNENLDEFLEANFEKRNFDKIKEMILQIFTFLSILDNPDEWLKNNATKSYDDEVNENEAIKILCTNAKFVFQHYEKQISELLDHLKRFYEEKDFESLINLRNETKKIIDCKNNDELIDLVLSFEVSAKATEKTKEFFSLNVKPLFDEFKKDLKKVKDSFAEDSAKKITQFLKSNKASSEFLCEMAKEFCLQYSEIKKQKFLLDFDDLEAKAKMLLDDDKIKDEIRSGFDYCFVDEYQDINILQEAIISSVAKNSFYFGVGDAKQAIYGFRLCSPEIFISKFADYKTEPQKNIAASLNKNFRSKINILRFVNKVFDVIMTEQTSQIDYRGQARFQSDNLDEKSKVNIKIILNEKNENDCLPEVYSVKNHNFIDDEDEENATYEADVAADEIRKLLNSGAAFRDIAILSRNRDSNEFVKLFFARLQEKNISVTANFRLNILKFPEISLIHNFIKLINNFKDDVVLYNVISFPIFQFSINDILDIRREGGEKTFSECFISLQDEKDKIKSFLNFVEKQKLIAQNLTVAEFAEHLFNKLMENDQLLSENALKNFEAYLAFIKEINPRSITDYCFLTQSDEIETTSAAGTKDDSVTFCTIHSSKGLEFKHVILIGTGRKMNLQDKNNVLVEEKIGVGIKGFDEDDQKKKTPIYTAINVKNRNKNFAEEIRLLYVALTRAKESLCVIGSISSGKFEKLERFKSDFEILKADNYLELILRSFSPGELTKLKASSNAKIIYEKNEVGACEVLNKEALAEMKKFKFEKNVLNFKNQLNLKDAEKNWERLTDTENVYLKNSVSSIMKNEKNEMEYSTALFQNDESTSNVLGTRYHEMFSKITFSKEDEKLNIPAGLNNNYFKMFFESDLYDFCKNKKVSKEMPFLFYDILPEKFGFGKNKILLQGVIDLIIEENDGFTVVDYKASHASDDVLKERYTTQLDLYAHCAEKILGKPCKKKLIYKIFSGKSTQIE